MLQFMGSQRVGPNLLTEGQQHWNLSLNAVSQFRLGSEKNPLGSYLISSSAPFVGCGSRTASSLYFECLGKALGMSLLAHVTPVSRADTCLMVARALWRAEQ